MLFNIGITFQENKDMLTKYRGWFLCIAFEIWFLYIAKSERWGAASTWENLVELKLFVHRVLSSHIAYVSKLQVWWNLWHSAANLHGCNVSSLSLVWKQVIWRELLLLNWSDEVLSNFGFYPLFLIKHGLCDIDIVGLVTASNHVWLLRVKWMQHLWTFSQQVAAHMALHRQMWTRRQ